MRCGGWAGFAAMAHRTFRAVNGVPGSPEHAERPRPAVRRERSPDRSRYDPIGGSQYSPDVLPSG